MLTSNQKECLKHMLSAYELTLDKIPGQDEVSFRFGRSVACSMVKSFLSWICYHGLSKEQLSSIEDFDIVSDSEKHVSFIEDLKHLISD